MHLNLQSPHEGFSWVFRFSSELFSSQAIIIIPTNPHFQAHPLLAPTPPSSILWTIHHCQAEPSSPPHVPVPHLVPKVPPSLTQENSNFTSEGHVHSQTCHSAEQRLPITQYQTHGQNPRYHRRPTVPLVQSHPKLDMPSTNYRICGSLVPSHI